MKDRPSAWLSRGAEGLTIIISILLALAAEAGWAYRSDRVDESELLAGLATEFVEADGEIANDLAARLAILAHTARLLAARDDVTSRPPADSMAEFATFVLDWRFYTPGHAVLEDALSSGRLSLIRSTEKREALMSYLQARERIPVFDAMERDFVANELEPYLADRVALDRLVGPAATEASRMREGLRLLALLDDDAFGSLLYLRHEYTRQASIYTREVQRAIARFRQTL